MSGLGLPPEGVTALASESRAAGALGGPNSAAHGEPSVAAARRGRAPRQALDTRRPQSKNGSFLEGRPVTETPLAEQDVVRLGEWLAVVTFVQARARLCTVLVRELQPGSSGGRRCARHSPAATRGQKRPERDARRETGTGKEFFARALNCTERPANLRAGQLRSVPEPLADAYLFGYKKGAFTGRRQRSAGIFQSAARRHAVSRRAR